MKPAFFILITLLLLGVLSCQEVKPKDDSEVFPDKEYSTEEYYFSRINNGDTLQLYFTQTGNKIKGEMVYNLYQKDKNQGIISGIIKGDTLFADYIFASEGITSEREVIFLMRNDSLIEGSGPVEQTSKKTKFKENSKLSFNKKMSLKRKNNAYK